MRRLLLLLLLLPALMPAAAEISAARALEEAAKKGSAYDSADYLEAAAARASDKGEKRAMYVYLGRLREQMGLYSEASAAYATAAGISAPDAEGSGRNPPESLALDAVRAELSAGNYENASRYLRSVPSNAEPEILARSRLYAQWCALCRANSLEETQSALAALKAYASQGDMESVRPAVLLTLWHLTGADLYSKSLKKSYPDSMECAVASGASHLAPAPFWYFVPRRGSSGTTVSSGIDDRTARNPAPAEAAPSAARKAEPKESGKKLQLGLFRDRANAEALASAVRKKGFSPKISSEVRPSGTTYYLVYVSEDGDTSISRKLKLAGFDNYPL